MKSRRRPPRRPQQSPAAITIGSSGEHLKHLNIDHRLYRCSAYYRMLIRHRLAADLWRFGEIWFDFVCGKNCCDLEETEAELVHQIWLDLPVGAPPLKKEAA